MAEKDYRSIAAQIIEIVGKDNIISATHCATRLRLIVKDKDAIDTKKLEKVDLVKGTFFNAGQYQIILGTGIVNKVYAELEGLGLHTISKQEQDEAVKQQQKGIKRMMRTLGDIFIPIIPVIAATGLFLGLKGCLFNDNVLGLFGASSSMIPDYIVTLVNVLTETAFSFLPAIICWSAFKVFGGTPVIGLVLGLMSSFLGIGGGPINLAVLSFFFSMKTKEAAINSLCVILLSQIASLVQMFVTASVPNVLPLFLFAMIAGGVTGGLTGQAINKRISSAQVDKLFVVMLLAVSAISLYNAYSFASLL